ncbi:hypothetical protein B0H63DRAFT_538313 [Podospora didyma]|uniref:Monooxygenase n=1 Tax=Podospora didyma TaxID=330526 RepID=A0AAE0U455_9PEZI|nr:hypothetical protein B0H63DRAFT_538313 [Podospora didyma]
MALSSLFHPTLHPFLFVFQLIQWVLGKILSPEPPNPSTRLARPKIAVIGAGITGVTSAAHCVGHGFDVVIFEAGPEDHLGGIWSKVNNTSGLQIHSSMYRFHPSVKWDSGYPNCQQIVSQVRQLWERYDLNLKTKFNTNVDKVYQDDRGRWIINNTANGHFEGVIAAIGTCGKPKMPHLPHMEDFSGPIYHSSDLTGKPAKDKTMIVIGGGASAVEAIEFATNEGARRVNILARSDKWIIPRNAVLDMLFAFNIFGQETFLSWIPETLLRKFFYRDLEDIAPGPDKGLFTETPMVNSDVLEKIRTGQAEWIRCDIDHFVENGVSVTRRGKGASPGSPGGHEEVIEGDMVVMATGFERPQLSFLPDSCYEKPYEPPNWYLQTFPPNHPSLCAINCTYMNAIGTVGNWHIGVYTRILLMFLVDPLTRPSPFWTRKWIDMTRFLKASSPVGAFDFFTYLELIWWFVFCVAFNPFRWKWVFFVFFGIGMVLPSRVVEAEDKIRNGAGLDSGTENRDIGIGF